MIGKYVYFMMLQKKNIRNDRFWYFWWRFPQEVNNLTIRVEYRNEIRTRKIRPQMCFLRVFFQCYHLFVCFQSCGNDKWVILFHLVCFGRTSKNTVKHGVTYRNVFFLIFSLLSFYGRIWFFLSISCDYEVDYQCWHGWLVLIWIIWYLIRVRYVTRLVRNISLDT